MESPFVAREKESIESPIVLPPSWSKDGNQDGRNKRGGEVRGLNMSLVWRVERRGEMVGGCVPVTGKNLLPCLKRGMGVWKRSVAVRSKSLGYVPWGY